MHLKTNQIKQLKNTFNLNLQILNGKKSSRNIILTAEILENVTEDIIWIKEN